MNDKECSPDAKKRYQEYQEALLKLINSGRFNIEYRYGRLVITPEMAKELPCPFDEDEDL